MRVEFRLDMPIIGSWNGAWSGAEKRYVLYRSMTKKRAKELALVTGKSRFFRYDFGDGWVASVTVRPMLMGERKNPSDGFDGYDWMVSNIIAYGSTREPTATTLPPVAEREE